MRLGVVLTLLLQVARAQPLAEVIGYLGDTIVLPSGADPSWNLSKIEWSTFSNTTWIATYRNGKKNIERIARYKGRLGLNSITEHLQKPTIRTLFNVPEEGGCLMVLSCSSTDDSVDLSWQVEPLTAFDARNAKTNPRVLVTFVNSTGNRVKFTCTSSKATEKASSAVAPRCDVADGRRCRYVLWFLLGVALGLATVVFYICRENIRALSKYLRGM
ncbi:uncharacterized protein si:cabz01074946.1 isoform X3 [Scophthalmus maximus]|uniref:uncharacterized protein si:cabz01074946.1 isoform X3 n=1 Tax=Scophthalmus maximus TaxID=52904 RepID=UPI0015E12301|nr:uncharacterized protein si:cabz01074946.1 isoform X3 [Scophthalmus maximus]